MLTHDFFRCANSDIDVDVNAAMRSLDGAFDFPFARIRTTRPGPIDNFLVCVGGRLSMPHIRKSTQELQRRLLAWMSPESHLEDVAKAALYDFHYEFHYEPPKVLTNCNDATKWNRTSSLIHGSTMSSKS
jgi:hypothetical protein